MKILYIGQYQLGSTSRMRGEAIQHIYTNAEFFVIDTSIPFDAANRFLRSITFKYKKGPLIERINKYIIAQIENTETDKFELIWVDKAVFVTSVTTQYLRSKTKKLIHFTPDMAFYINQSNHFFNSIGFYDFLITTKTAEINLYKEVIDNSKLIITTQGIDPTIHCPLIPFIKKKQSIAFIGLFESSRGKIIQTLIDNGISVNVAGMGWESFNKKNNKNNHFKYYGSGFYSSHYANFISSSSFGLGLLSKKFPEYHTTRTFEIPACGTALITERNHETRSFFEEDEVIFYDTVNEMIDKIRYYYAHPIELEILTTKGIERIKQDGRDYESILRKLIHQTQHN